MKIPIRPDSDNQPSDEQDDLVLVPPNERLPMPKKAGKASSEFIERLKNWRLTDLQQWMMGMARGRVRGPDQKAQIAWVNKYVQGIIDLFAKRRGRPPKPEGAQTSAQRVQKYRQRKLNEAEKQQIEEKIDKLHALYPHWSKKTLRRYLASESRSQTVQTPQQFYDQMIERIEILEAPAEVVVKMPGDLERIDAAIQRDDEIGGRRGKPEGYGNFSDQEGYATSASLARGQTEVPAQQRYGTSPTSVAQWKRFEEKQQDAYLAAAVWSFLDENFESKTKTEDGINKVWLRCKLCGWQSAPASEIDDEIDIDELDANQWQWDTASDHARHVHETELSRFMRQNLPAWISKARERRLENKKIKGECPRKAEHESMRLKAVERGDKEAMPCPVCGQTVYIPKNAAIRAG